MAEPARALSAVDQDAQTLTLLAELRVLLEHHTVPARGYLTIGQAALYLGAHVNTLREWIRTKRLPYYKPGKELRFKRAELDAWMERFRRQEGAWPC
jgi:excisionase family DNA binding protein